ncbi:MAG TPA: hypothetical protein VFA98_01880 [Thermoanaerobaculia bacterium]|nr:hypothetical protein [Thermoanaerobaculia bacterium]
MPDPASPAALEPADLVSLLRSPDAPRELRSFAARGLLPLEREDRLRALLAVVNDADPDVAAAAAATFAAVPPDDVARFLDAGGPTTAELDAVSRRTDDHAVLEQVVRNRETSDETLERLAATVGGAPQDALIVNQVRLLRHPSLIDALLENPELTADGRRRLLELKEEFFEKEERRILIADANKIVSMAVLRNEALTPAEVETFCAMRHLATELFQEIATTREWIRKPKIQLALVCNPAVPLSITLPLIKYVGMRDLRNLSRDRNLPEGVRMMARKILIEKRG